jgi:hypothetical protein
MSLYVIAFLVILILFVILTFIGSRMEQVIYLEVKRKIPFDSAAVFHEIGDLQRFVLWSPWSGKDPDLKMEFSGEPLSVGSCYTWNGNRSVGQGKMEIVHLEANEKIDMDLEFGRRALSKTGFLLESQGQETLVTWYFESDLGTSPVNRLIGPIMKKFVAKDFERGLEQLENHLKAL